MRNIIVLIFTIVNLTTVLKGQDLLMLSNNFTNGEINKVDTLDALIKRGNLYELIPTVIVKDSVYNPAWNMWQANYKYKLSEEPLLFFKYHHFKKKEIIGEFKNYFFIYPDTTINYSIGNNFYSFQSKGTILDHGSYKTISNYEIIISAVENGEKHLFSLIRCPSVQISNINFIEAPKLVWVGDLDCDNKLDLIISESTHYALYSRSLYLSSERNENNYVKKAEISGSCD